MRKNLELAQVHLHDIYRRIYKTRKALPRSSEIIVALQKAHPHLARHAEEWYEREDEPSCAVCFMWAASRLAKRVERARPDECKKFECWRIFDSFLQQLQDKGLKPYQLWTRLPHVESFYPFDSDPSVDDEDSLSDFDPGSVLIPDDSDSDSNEPPTLRLGSGAPMSPRRLEHGPTSLRTPELPSKKRKSDIMTVPAESIGPWHKRSRISSMSPSFGTDRELQTTAFSSASRSCTSNADCISLFGSDLDEDEKDELDVELEGSVSDHTPTATPQQSASSVISRNVECSNSITPSSTSRASLLSLDAEKIPFNLVSTSGHAFSFKQLIEANRSLRESIPKPTCSSCAARNLHCSFVSDSQKCMTCQKARRPCSFTSDQVDGINKLRDMAFRASEAHQHPSQSEINQQISNILTKQSTFISLIETSEKLRREALALHASIESDQETLRRSSTFGTVLHFLEADKEFRLTEENAETLVDALGWRTDRPTRAGVKR